MKIEPRTLKGFRDFLPNEARKRQYVINILKRVFESYGFEPLETPALEYAEILTGKYGDEGDKLMYRFKDKGDRDVAMRYDQTIPLARVIAQYPVNIPKPFKRYQIQNVWRAENPQRGRFREFLQCDIDNVGDPTNYSSAEILVCIYDCLKSLGIKNFEIGINDRDSLTYDELGTKFQLPEDVAQNFVRSMDKLEKKSRSEVTNEIVENSRGFLDLNLTNSILDQIEKSTPSDKITFIINTAIKMGVPSNTIKFRPMLVRGLDYYTDEIFEVTVDGYKGSIGGGGRYNGLVNMFLDYLDSIPAVGFAFGFDRLMEVMEEQELLPDNIFNKKVLISSLSSDPSVKDKTIEFAQKLRKETIATDLIFTDEFTTGNIIDDVENRKPEKIKKLLYRFSDTKKVDFIVLVDEKSLNDNYLEVKNAKNQKAYMRISFENLLEHLRS